jgi:protein SCO1/2
MTAIFTLFRAARALAIGCSLLATVIAHAAVTAAPAAAASWGKDYLPNAVLFDQNGKRVRFYDDVIKGRIVVVSFIYTSCIDMCPLTTARLVRMQGLLDPEAAKKVTFVSISIDPENDTPERLKQYADAMGATAGWVFLTGPKPVIDDIRYRLGERTKKLQEHRKGILLGNEATGEWEHSSAFGDLGVLAMTVRAMDPELRDEVRSVASLQDDGSGEAPKEHPGQALYLKTCAACHSIGKGDIVGPDLAGVTARRDRSWVVKYITIPNKVRAAKDPIALELRQKFKHVRMPNLGIAEAEAADLISYIESQTVPN